MKKWVIKNEENSALVELSSTAAHQKILNILLNNRGIADPQAQHEFLHPKDPYTLTPEDVDIDAQKLTAAVARIKKAIDEKESIVVYADYDADGITAGTIMWEAITRLGGKATPYIPHRVDEGYGFSYKGIDNVIDKHHPSLIISVDHGITAHDKVAYAMSKGIDVIVTDHHVAPEKIPQCLLVHTTKLCGAGVAWFVSKTLAPNLKTTDKQELLALACIGTIADLVPLQNANRSIAFHGLHALNKTKRIGLEQLLLDSGLSIGEIGTYEISHILAPRLNAMGRLTHALDALRLLCTGSREKAQQLAQLLGSTNRERQDLTTESTDLAKALVEDLKLVETQKLLIIQHESFNEGVIGLIAGKLVETYYRPSIVLTTNGTKAKASARSIAGFNIIEAIRASSKYLLEAGGHPMAAGFTLEVSQIEPFSQHIQQLANAQITDEHLTRTLLIDMKLPLSLVDEHLHNIILQTAPWGMGNTQPTFVSPMILDDIRQIGKEGKHIKLMVKDENGRRIEVIGFGMGVLMKELIDSPIFEAVYTIDISTWGDRKTLQLKIKDLKFEENFEATL